MRFPRYQELFVQEFLSLRWFVAENAAFLSKSHRLNPTLSSPPTAEEMTGMFILEDAFVDAWKQVRDVWEEPS